MRADAARHEDAAEDAGAAQLADALDDLAQFLADQGEAFWADWVGKDAAWARNGDGHAVTHFLSAFGGMGSLNDVLFHPRHGNVATSEEGGRLQERFADLKSKAWLLAHSLRSG